MLAKLRKGDATSHPNARHPLQVPAMPAGSVVPSNSPFKLVSLQSGRYCKVVSVWGTQQLQCDAAEGSGSNFTYSAGGLFYQVSGRVCWDCAAATPSWDWLTCEVESVACTL
jgi:hypothetical protein